MTRYPGPGFSQHADRRTNLPGGAVSTLEGVVFDKGCLQRVQCVGRPQAFDGYHRIAIVHDGEREAGLDTAAVYQDRAGAALPVIAALLRTAQPQMLS